jgi:hypothetical protein
MVVAIIQMIMPKCQEWLGGPGDRAVTGDAGGWAGSVSCIRGLCGEWVSAGIAGTGGVGVDTDEERRAVYICRRAVNANFVIGGQMKRVILRALLIIFFLSAANETFAEKVNVEDPNNITMRISAAIACFGGGIGYERLIIDNFSGEGSLSVGADFGFNLDQRTDYNEFALLYNAAIFCRWYPWEWGVFAEMGAGYLFPMDKELFNYSAFYFSPAMGWRISGAYDFLKFIPSVSFDIFFGDIKGILPRFNAIAVFSF